MLVDEELESGSDVDLPPSEDELKLLDHGGAEGAQEEADSKGDDDDDEDDDGDGAADDGDGAADEGDDVSQEEADSANAVAAPKRSVKRQVFLFSATLTLASAGREERAQKGGGKGKKRPQQLSMLGV